MAWPMRYVTSAATPPSASCLRPQRTGGRWVRKLTPSPSRKRAPSESDDAAHERRHATDEQEWQQRDDGTGDEGDEGAHRRCPRAADGPGIEAHLVAEHRLEGTLGRREQRVHDGARLIVGEPALPVDALQDRPLARLVLLQLPFLESVLRLEQLVLRADRDVLTDGHREGAGEEPGDARDDDGLVVRRGARDAHHQRQVRDETVAAAEDRRPQERCRATLVGRGRGGGIRLAVGSAP